MWYNAVQMRNAVTTYFSSDQLLSYGFVQQHTHRTRRIDLAVCNAVLKHMSDGRLEWTGYVATMAEVFYKQHVDIQCGTDHGQSSTLFGTL